MVQFCHFSDVHLPLQGKPQLSQLLGKRVTGYANWQNKRQHQVSQTLIDQLVEHAQKQSSDLFLVTGDLVNIAIQSEIKRAHAWLQNLAAADKVALALGNHDAYTADGFDMAVKIWADYLQGDGTIDLPKENGNDQQLSWREIEAQFPQRKRVGNCAIFSMNSGIPTAPFRATGVVSGAQLKRLGTLLKEAEKDGLCRIVLIHHPPFAKATHYHKRLIAAHKLREVINKSGCELVLHGHTHLDTIKYLPSQGRNIPCLCVPATGQLPGFKRPAGGYNLIKIEESNIGWNMQVDLMSTKSASAENLPIESVRHSEFDVAMPQLYTST